MSGEVIYPLNGKRIWVAGHRGMVGSALVRRLERENCTILTAGRDVCDLTRQEPRSRPGCGRKSLMSP